ncbi:MAG: succinate dehydrogenase [Phycisphaerales bacterium]|nr:MAG: succinate dehydrogenase [Phycisphaerales bacterium]
MPRRSRYLTIGRTRVAPGERRDLSVVVSESYSSQPVVVPVTVWRADKPGPAMFISAAVHGDELNGTGVVRQLLLDPPFKLAAGSLVLIPVVNVLGLDRHQRYLPDRRDLNRSFPGDTHGSLARRFAHAIFDGVVSNCDFGIDLHTAAVRRTNFPNVRGNLAQPDVARLAFATGSQVVINGRGPKGSLRRSACLAGCPTIIVEAGEVWKIEPSVVEFGVRCVRNALIELGMVRGRPKAPVYQVQVDRTEWIRAELGGILQFHVAPGDVVRVGQALATNADLLGRQRNVIRASEAGIVIGMTTLPVVNPGDPVCHLAMPNGGIEAIVEARARADGRTLDERLRDDLSTNVFVSHPAGASDAGRR